ncbi:hypothetical protein BJV78DRAFT_1224223 [Lactifluus subvellereus]|nr:hypothetical protein BJV78DRAFT_1224223 [Lactifluus subvellereus]
MSPSLFPSFRLLLLTPLWDRAGSLTTQCLFFSIQFQGSKRRSRTPTALSACPHPLPLPNDTSASFCASSGSSRVLSGWSNICATSPGAARSLSRTWVSSRSAPMDVITSSFCETNGPRVGLAIRGRTPYAFVVFVRMLPGRGMRIACTASGAFSPVEA